MFRMGRYEIADWSGTLYICLVDIFIVDMNSCDQKVTLVNLHLQFPTLISL